MNEKEINQLIHEKIFDKCFHCWMSIDDFNFRCGKCLAVEIETELSYPPRPNYCEDIAAAFQVVEKMREKGFYLALHTNNHSAYFYTKKNALISMISDVVFGETDAEAICLAALEAIK
jgi:hypothetical protein